MCTKTPRECVYLTRQNHLISLVASHGVATAIIHSMVYIVRFWALINRSGLACANQCGWVMNMIFSQCVVVGASQFPLTTLLLWCMLYVNLVSCGVACLSGEGVW